MTLEQLDQKLSDFLENQKTRDALMMAQMKELVSPIQHDIDLAWWVIKFVGSPTGLIGVVLAGLKVWGFIHGH